MADGAGGTGLGVPNPSRLNRLAPVTWATPTLTAISPSWYSVGGINIRRLINIERRGVMKSLLSWIAVPLLLLAAGMLIAGIGAPGVWITVVTVGIALVIVGQLRPNAPGRR